MPRASLGSLVIAGLLLLSACGPKPAGHQGGGAATTVPAPTPTPRGTATTTPTAVVLPPAAGPGRGVVFADASHGWSLVGCGAAGSGASPVPGSACRLLATRDGGKTWVERAKGLPASARLQFLSPQVGFATVNGGNCIQGKCPGVILATADGGKTWSKRYTGPLNLSSIDFASAKSGWAMVAGALYHSTDGGAHWSATVPAAAPTFPACKLRFVRFATSRAGIAGGGSSRGPCVIVTADGGATWRATVLGADSQSLSAAMAAYAKAMKFSGELQTMWKGGRQCVAERAQVAPGGAGWLEIICDPFNPGALAVMHTSDGGHGWHYAWGVAACLMGCHSVNGGKQPLFFLNGTTAWRVAPHGAQRTTDGGDTWTAGQDLCQDPGCQVNLAFVSAADGWATTVSGQALYATRDGGRTWTKAWPQA